MARLFWHPRWSILCSVAVILSGCTQAPGGDAATTVPIPLESAYSEARNSSDVTEGAKLVAIGATERPFPAPFMDELALFSSLPPSPPDPEVDGHILQWVMVFREGTRLTSVAVEADGVVGSHTIDRPSAPQEWPFLDALPSMTPRAALQRAGEAGLLDDCFDGSTWPLYATAPVANPAVWEIAVQRNGSDGPPIGVLEVGHDGINEVVSPRCTSPPSVGWQGQLHFDPGVTRKTIEVEVNSSDHGRVRLAYAPTVQLGPNVRVVTSIEGPHGIWSDELRHAQCDVGCRGGRAHGDVVPAGLWKLHFNVTGGELTMDVAYCFDGTPDASSQEGCDFVEAVWQGERPDGERAEANCDRCAPRSLPALPCAGTTTATANDANGNEAA